MIQYDDKRWIEHFRVNRSFVKQLTKKLKHKMEEKDTKYRSTILVSIKVACSLYKLAHASEYLQYSEFFCHWKIYYSISAPRVCSCCKWCFQGSTSMAWTWKIVSNYGGVQKVVKVAKYSRCNKCNSNSHLKAKGYHLCRRLLFIQVEGI